MFALIWPHLVGCLGCAARLLPIAFLCPLLGGPWTPSTVKLGIVLSFSLALHFGGGVGATLQFGAAPLLALGVRELALGIAMGLIAALPFEAVRMAGRWTDTLRGASAEALLPGSGSREAATGELLHGLVVALAVVGRAWPASIEALWRTFRVLPLGRWVPDDAGALAVASAVGEGMASSLALGAPVAGACLLAEVAIGLAARAGPLAHFAELAAPVRLLGGALLIWLGLGTFSDRALEAVSRLAEGWLHL